MCPVTDVVIVENDKKDDYMTQLGSSYEQVEAPAGVELAWTMLISKEVGKAPVYKLELGTEPHCNGKVVGDAAK